VKNESKSLSFVEGFRVRLRLKSFRNKTPPISRGQ
jgi:hypothetical protein